MYEKRSVVMVTCTMLITTMDTANLPLHQISGRGGLCDPLGDSNVWTVPQGISDDLSDRRIILVATKVSTFLIW